MAFDLETEKRNTVARLEALERLALDKKKLEASLNSLNVVEVIENYIKAEVEKIEKFAKKHGIDFSIPTADLVAKVVIPGSTPVAQGASHPSQTLPFLPEDGSSLYDQAGDEWSLDGTTWSKEEWNDSGCEWNSSSQYC